jgi:hypothetical protein
MPGQWLVTNTDSKRFRQMRYCNLCGGREADSQIVRSDAKHPLVFRFVGGGNDVRSLRDQSR